MSEGSYAVRLLNAGDVDAYVEHRRRHDGDSLRRGELPDSPYACDEVQPALAIRKRAIERWASPLTSPNWRRVWGLWCGVEVVGHVSLAGGVLNASRHRAQLGVGIERLHRGQGHGRRLLETTIAWARDVPSLDWLDLGVFEGNTVALGLYQKLGFEQSGFTRDLFRVEGLSLNNIHMARWVGLRTGLDHGTPATG